MKSLEQIKAALKDRRLYVVSEATGINYNTLRKIRDEDSPNPTYKIMKSISDYLEGK